MPGLARHAWLRRAGRDGEDRLDLEEPGEGPALVEVALPEQLLFSGRERV